MNHSLVPVVRPTSTARAAACAAAIVCAAVAPVRAGTAVEPVRRDARLDVTTTGSSADPAFVSGALVISAATTRELAAYARAAGAPAAAEWLCDAYTDAPAIDPSAASLKRLIATAAATDAGGQAAADAFVCPSLPRRLYGTRTVVEIFSCIFGHCDTETIRFRKHIVAYRGCDATDVQRAAFDSTACRNVLLGRSERASTLRFFAKRSTKVGGCLAITLRAEKPTVRLDLNGSIPCELPPRR
jgi:hypothetical protein